MHPSNKMEKTDFHEARAKLETMLGNRVFILGEFLSFFDKSMTSYGEENTTGLNLVGILDKDLSSFTGLGHLGLLMPRARIKIRYAKEKGKLDLEMGVLLGEYGKRDNRRDPFERMRMEITFERGDDTPSFLIRRFRPEMSLMTDRETVRPVDQGLELLLRFIAGRMGVPRGHVKRIDISRPKHMPA
ncbi:MAG: hypothetical protein O2807_05525 [bacterium]|nr:hypothetical protein [bacterium]